VTSRRAGSGRTPLPDTLNHLRGTTKGSRLPRYSVTTPSFASTRPPMNSSSGCGVASTSRSSSRGSRRTSSFIGTTSCSSTRTGANTATWPRISELPNACLFGFAGTPIDKNDRSTLQTFGSYIDTYTIEQAVADDATVPVFYEGRLAELGIIGYTLDAIFDRVFADRSDEGRTCTCVARRSFMAPGCARAPRKTPPLRQSECQSASALRLLR